jgi:DNA repair exonuclease SbcCD ATPase subunit
MQIQKINIRSVLGIEEFELFPGKINKISSKNGRGKTSILEALKIALKGGNDAELIHNGNDEGEIVIIFDNNMHLKRRIRGSKRGILELHDGDGREISAPQATINSLYDAIAVNPVEFINVNDKQRTELLLEALPVEMNLEEILARIECETELLGVRAGERDKLQSVYDKKFNNALDFIDAIIDDLSSERKFIRKSLDQAKAVIKPLTETLVELDIDEEATKDNIQRIETTLENGAKRYEEALGEINSDYNKRVEALTQEFQEQKELLRDRYEQAKSGYKEELTRLKADLDSVAGLLKTKEELERQEARKEKLEIEWQLHENSLKGLREYKINLLSDLPITGLELREGVIYKNDIPFSRLNTAQQLEIAIEIAKVRTKDIGIICVDGIEILDSESQEMIFKKFEQSGLQFFLTEVTEDEELKVEKSWS